MPSSIARHLEDFRADRARSRRRWLIAAAVLVAVGVGMFVLVRIGSRLFPTPQPAEARKITVDGQEKLVSMSVSRGLTMSGDRPITVSVCTDGTVVCDVEGLIEAGFRYTDRATPAQVERLEDAFDRADFMDLRKDYASQDSTCAPWYVVYRLDGAKTKLVRYYGGDTSAPEGLSRLVAEFWEALPIDRWVYEAAQTRSAKRR